MRSAWNVPSCLTHDFSATCYVVWLVLRYANRLQAVDPRPYGFDNPLLGSGTSDRIPELGGLKLSGGR